VAQFWLILAVALTVGAILFGVTLLISGKDPGLRPVEPDGRSVPLPGHRPLTEADLSEVRFEVTVRGYRMTEVDAALRRAAYDIGYKDELIGVLEAEVRALRAGRIAEAESLRRAREAALAPVRQAVAQPTEAARAREDTDRAREDPDPGEAADRTGAGEDDAREASSAPEDTPRPDGPARAGGAA